MPNRGKEHRYISKNYQRVDIGRVKVKINDNLKELTVEIPVDLEPKDIPLPLPDLSEKEKKLVDEKIIFNKEESKSIF